MEVRVAKIEKQSKKRKAIFMKSMAASFTDSEDKKSEIRVFNASTGQYISFKK